MARPMASADDQVIETWESATEAAVWISTWSRRTESYEKIQIAGRAGRKSYVSRDDRRYNQEIIIPENARHDPFTNGTLRFVTANTVADDLDLTNQLLDSDLSVYLDERDDGLFKESLGLLNEVNLRRLYAIGEKSATVTQLDILRDLIYELYPVGGQQRMVREMEAEEARLGSSMRN